MSEKDSPKPEQPAPPDDAAAASDDSPPSNADKAAEIADEKEKSGAETVV